MINVFYKNRNTIGQFMVALIFLGTFGFLFTFDGFVSESQASGCCGSGEAAVTSFAADSSGDFGSEIPMDAPATDGCCGGEDNTILTSDSSDCNCLNDGTTSCGKCGDSTCSGSQTQSCANTCTSESRQCGDVCCTDTDLAEYCPSDDNADPDVCEGTASGCDKP